MRYLYKAILFFILGLTLQACIKEYPVYNNSSVTESVELNIGITTRVGESNQISTGALGDAEFAISSLRIYAFDSAGALDKIYFQEYSAPIVNSITVQFEVLKATSKDLYIVINEPSTLTSALDIIGSSDELMAINYTIAGAMNEAFVANSIFAKESFVIPMTAVKTIDASADTDITIEMDRAVARVDLMLDKSNDNKEVALTSQTTFTVNGVRYQSKLFEPEKLTNSSEAGSSISATSTNVTLEAQNSDRSSAIRVLSFYLAERLYDYTDADDQVKITIDKLEVGGTMTTLNENSVILGADDDTATNTPITEINRNYVYQIYATYDITDEVVVADDFVIVPWTYEIINGDIEGSLFAVDLVRAMDWLRNGNSYTADVLSFGSNKPIEIYLPVTTGNSTVVNGLTIPEYEYVKYDFSFTTGASYDLKNLGLANSYIEVTDWIDEATLVFTSSYSGYVRYTYKHSLVHYMLIDFPIRLKSENVTKDMVAIYDNGYIPCEYLPDYWQDRAPSGLIISKRGRGLNPTTVDDILYSDQDGFYTGEHKTTIAEMADYCTNELSPNWYVPSKVEMLEAQQSIRMLGTSYRLQDCGDDVLDRALYWSSTPDDDIEGNYWAIDFSQGATLGTVVSMPATEELFVRCVVDLK